MGMVQAVLTTPVARVPRFARRKRGIGHFAAIALSAAAAVGFFAILYPVAKSMMSQTVTSMQTVQQEVLNSTVENVT